MGGSIKHAERTNLYSAGCGLYSRIKSFKKVEAIGFCNPLLPTLPKALSGHALVVTDKNNLMIVGGETLTGIGAMTAGYNPKNGRICYILENGNWKCHSMLSQRKLKAIAIRMINGIYAFGGGLCIRYSFH